jgi:hypothetical protein
MNTKRSAQLGKDEAIAVALRRYSLEVEQTNTYDASAERSGGKWHVHIQWLPAKPGGHVTVIVSDEGTITRVMPGM